MDKTRGDAGDLLNGGQECGLVRLRGFGKAADFSHELERSIPDFFRSDGRVKIEKGFDISTHFLLHLLWMIEVEL